MSKTCVISSNLEAISDIVKNEETGLRVDVKNKNILSQKIIELIKNKEKRRKLLENGYNFVRNNFSWKIISDKYYNLINVW